MREHNWARALREAKRLTAGDQLAKLQAAVGAIHAARLDGELWCATPGCSCPGRPDPASLLASGEVAWPDLTVAVQEHAAAWGGPPGEQ
jgi:hypothetical protein